MPTLNPPIEAESTASEPEAGLFVLIACAGVGSRALQAGAPALPKQYQRLCGQTLLAHTLQVFDALGDLIRAVAVAVAPDDPYIDALGLPAKVHVLRCGGASRADSVRQGLEHWRQKAGGPRASDWVLVHDAARCLLLPEQVRELVARCRHDAVGGLLALPLPDTLKSESGGRVVQTIDRADKWLAQTPQMFRLGALEQAIVQAQAQGLQIPDEASAMAASGHRPLLVAGSAHNFKITYPSDFALAQAVLQARRQSTEEVQP